MAQAPKLPVGAVLPNLINFATYYSGGLQYRFYWELPEAGAYKLESSPDLQTWTFAGSANPGSPSTYGLNIDPTAPPLAYRMTKTA